MNCQQGEPVGGLRLSGPHPPYQWNTGTVCVCVEGEGPQMEEPDKGSLAPPLCHYHVDGVQSTVFVFCLFVVVFYGVGGR